MEPAATECMCTTLRMATRRIDRLYSQALAEVGLRPVSYAFLSRLSADGPLMVSQLADRLVLERTTCTRELQPLTRAGLVTIEPGADRRQRVVHLTPEGEMKLAQGRPHWEAVQRRVAAAFGTGPTDELLGRLRELLVQTRQLMDR